MDYIALVSLYEKINSTSKRTEKVFILSQFFSRAIASEAKAIGQAKALDKKLSKEEKANNRTSKLRKQEEAVLRKLVILAQGRVFPVWVDKTIGVATKLVIKAISRSVGQSIQEIERLWSKKGDLGLVAYELISKKRQQTLFSLKLTISKVFSNLRKLAELQGKGTVDKKLMLISELLSNASPKEALYIVRTLLEELRVGIGETTIRDAIALSVLSNRLKAKGLEIGYDKEKNSLVMPDETKEDYLKAQELIQAAYDILSDFGEIAVVIADKGIDGLRSIKIRPFRPIRLMLYQKVASIEEGFSAVGKPAALEYKYDGFRVQIHLLEDKVLLFTRKLENVTEQFPDVVEAVKRHVNAKSAIIDAEIVGIKKGTSSYLPFQAISQRIRRKYDIIETAKSFPVEVNAFDIIYYNTKTLLNKPFHERRSILSRIIEPKELVILPSRITITDNAKEAEEFYNDSLKRGNEGIMMKSLNAIYKPGSRVGFGVKLKAVMDNLDLAIVAAEWGEGKRANWLTSFTVACKGDEGELLEIGKVSTGIKELKEQGTSYEELTELLKPLILAETGKKVKLKPKIVIEVKYEEIQKSPNYSSGFALRFPRFVRLRDIERSVEDIDEIATIKELYRKQRGRNS